MDGIVVVVRAFAHYAPGDVIDNPARIATILRGEHGNCVVRAGTPGPGTPHRGDA